MLYFGIDYYPEQWPEERWLEDARLMAEAGSNMVRLAEFVWLLPLVNPTIPALTYDRLTWGSRITSASSC
jgi:hypothetical protein